MKTPRIAATALTSEWEKKSPAAKQGMFDIKSARQSEHHNADYADYIAGFFKKLSSVNLPGP